MSCGCNKKTLGASLDALRILQDKYISEGARILFNLDINLKNKNTLPDHVDFLESIEAQVLKYTNNQYVLDTLSSIIEVYLNTDDGEDDKTE
jgi:hypothetical protein